RDTMVQQLEVFAVPTADFTFDTVCYPLNTQFADLSTVAAPATIDDWHWEFGDSYENMVDQDPEHGYAQWGDYTVTLTVTTGDGCVHSTTLGPARVHPEPAAIFSSVIANCHED